MLGISQSHSPKRPEFHYIIFNVERESYSDCNILTNVTVLVRKASVGFLSMYEQ